MPESAPAPRRPTPAEVRAAEDGIITALARLLLAPRVGGVWSGRCDGAAPAPAARQKRRRRAAS